LIVKLVFADTRKTRHGESCIARGVAVHGKTRATATIDWTLPRRCDSLQHYFANIGGLVHFGTGSYE